MIIGDAPARLHADRRARPLLEDIRHVLHGQQARRCKASVSVILLHVTLSCAQVLGRRDARAREAARRSDRIDTHFDRYRRHHQRRAGEICRDHAEIICDRCSRAIATPERISRRDLPQASFSGMDVHSGLAINRDDVCTAPKMEGGTSTENLALQNIQALRIEQKMIVLPSHGHA